MESDHLEDLGVDVRVILKWHLRIGLGCMDLILAREGHLEGSFAETFRSIDSGAYSF